MRANPLGNLVIDYWYKALTVSGVFILALSLVFKTIGIDNKIVQEIALGTAFIGIGEWINHPLQTQLMSPNIYTGTGGILTSHNRNSCYLGNLFDIFGFVLVCLGSYEILYK